MRRRLTALVAVGLGAAALVAVGLLGIAAPLPPKFPTTAGHSAVPGQEVFDKSALLGSERGPEVVPRAATMSPVASPSPTGSAPTSSGPDLRFILIGIGCILFAIVITVRARREGRSERGWF